MSVVCQYYVGFMSVLCQYIGKYSYDNKLIFRKID